MIKIENRLHIEAHKENNLFVHITCFDDLEEIRFTIGAAPRLNESNSKEQLDEQALRTITLTAGEAFKLAEFLNGAGAQAAEVGCMRREKEIANIYPIKKP